VASASETDVASGFSRTNSSPSTIANEIAAADHFSKVLRPANERDEVERRVDDAAEQPLPPHGAANRSQRHYPADPWKGSRQTTREPAGAVLP
jgi:hypothetical protein